MSRLRIAATSSGLFAGRTTVTTGPIRHLHTEMGAYLRASTQAQTFRPANLDAATHIASNYCWLLAILCPLCANCGNQRNIAAELIRYTAQMRFQLFSLAAILSLSLSSCQHAAGPAVEVATQGGV